MCRTLTMLLAAAVLALAACGADNALEPSLR